MCMWKWGGSAPCGQAHVLRPNGPECAKSHATSQSPSSRTEKLRTFSIFLFFDLFQGPPGRFLRFQRCRPCFVAGILFDGSGRTRKAKSNSGLRENPYSEKLADFPYMHVEMGWICPIWPSARFATKLAPMCKKPCCLAVPLIKG